MDEATAKRIVSAIFSELNGRRGIGHELRGIHEDTEVYDEMYRACVMRVRNAVDGNVAKWDKAWEPK